MISPDGKTIVQRQIADHQRNVQDCSFEFHHGRYGFVFAKDSASRYSSSARVLTTNLVVELGQYEAQRRFKDRLRLIRREALFLNHPSITDTVYHIASHVDILALTGTDNPGDHLTGMNPDGDAQRRG